MAAKSEKKVITPGTEVSLVISANSLPTRAGCKRAFNVRNYIIHDCILCVTNIHYLSGLTSISITSVHLYCFSINHLLSIRSVLGKQIRFSDYISPQLDGFKINIYVFPPLCAYFLSILTLNRINRSRTSRIRIYSVIQDIARCFLCCLVIHSPIQSRIHLIENIDGNLSINQIAIVISYT